MNRKSWNAFGKGKKARVMRRDEAGHGGAAGGAVNNQGQAASGNTGTESNQGGNTNNSGQQFDPSSFWNSSAGGEPAASKEGSAGTGTQPAGNQGNQQQDAGTNIGQQFATTLQNLAFAPVFTQETANQIADGNLEGVNKAVMDSHRESVKTSVTMAAQLMQTYGQHLLSQVQEMINGSFMSKDNESSLAKEFPQIARDPAMKPLIQNIFNKAMENNGHNREKAIAMTRDMLTYMGKGVGAELGLNTAPGNPGDNMSSGALSLVEELMAR